MFKPADRLAPEKSAPGGCCCPGGVLLSRGGVLLPRGGVAGRRTRAAGVATNAHGRRVSEESRVTALRQEGLHCLSSRANTPTVFQRPSAHIQVSHIAAWRLREEARPIGGPLPAIDEPRVASVGPHVPQLRGHHASKAPLHVHCRVLGRLELAQRSRARLERGDAMLGGLAAERVEVGLRGVREADAPA